MILGKLLNFSGPEIVCVCVYYYVYFPCLFELVLSTSALDLHPEKPLKYPKLKMHVVLLTY